MSPVSSVPLSLIVVLALMLISSSLVTDVFTVTEPALPVPPMSCAPPTTPVSDPIVPNTILPCVAVMLMLPSLASTDVYVFVPVPLVALSVSATPNMSPVSSAPLSLIVVLAVMLMSSSLVTDVFTVTEPALAVTPMSCAPPATPVSDPIVPNTILPCVAVMLMLPSLASTDVYVFVPV